MAKCQSWRPMKSLAGHPAHQPGTCRVCWGLCRASIGKGEVRCQDCTKALLTHPLAAVRAMLASEVGTYGDDVLMALAHDPELSVSINAQSQLKKRTRAQSGVLHEIF